MAALLQSHFDDNRRYDAMAAWLKAHAGDHLTPLGADLNGLVEDWAQYSGQTDDPERALQNHYHPVWEAARSALLAAEFAAAREEFAAMIEKAVR